MIRVTRHPIVLILVAVICTSLSKNTVIPVVDAKYVLSIEPYIAEWCAGQFGSLPTASGLFEATNGINLAQMIKKKSYKLAEPYFGGYCFDVFGRDQLKELNREETLFELSKRGKHVEIEPYLMAWGELASDSGNMPDLEQYVSTWCIQGQFREYMTDQTRAFEMAERYAGQIEVALAPWCWKQFPNEMKGLAESFYIKRMETEKPVKIEPYLMKWEITNYHVRKHPGMGNSDMTTGGGGGGGFWRFLRSVLVLVGVVYAIGYVHKHHPQVTEQARDKVQQIFTLVGSSLQQQTQMQPDFQYSSMPMTAPMTSASSDDNRINQNLM